MPRLTPLLFGCAAKSVALAVALASADAFLPTFRAPGLAPASSLRAVARRPALVSLRAQSYLDDMNEQSKSVQLNDRGAPLMPDYDYTVPAYALPIPPHIPARQALRAGVCLCEAPCHTTRCKGGSHPPTQALRTVLTEFVSTGQLDWRSCPARTTPLFNSTFATNTASPLQSPAGVPRS